MNKINTKAFTLVELIVVITILAILGTIAFISLQSYTVYARDSVRISNLRTIESSLKIQYTQGGAYAVPDNSVNITASGTVIRKQGIFGKQALRTVKLNSDASEDPLTGENYDYIVDNNLSEYQLVGYMEGEEAQFSSFSNTYALTGSTLKTLGQDLGIVFSGGVAVHKSGIDVDIRQPDGELTIVFDEGDEITSSSGSELFSNVYNRSKALLKNKELAKLDDSLVLYYDMETTTMSGSLKVLEDLSPNNNHGVCGGNGVPDTDCGEGLFSESIGIPNEKGIRFSQSNQYIRIAGIQDYQKSFTIQVKGSLDFVNTGVAHQTFFGMYNTWEDRHYLFCQDTAEYKFFGRSTQSGTAETSVNIFSGKTCIENELLILNVSGGSDKGSVQFYSNGIMQKGGEYIESNFGDVYLGRLGSSGAALFGHIYEVRIYNRVLSEKEIKTIYGSTIN